jgi:hypothetical protein
MAEGSAECISGQVLQSSAVISQHPKYAGKYIIFSGLVDKVHSIVSENVGGISNSKVHFKNKTFKAKLSLE